MRRPAGARLAAVAVVLLAATGCVSIPESSTVQPGRAVNAQDEQPLSRNQPNGPRPGAGRKEIATGYLNAMLAFPPAPDVVRQFLTADAAADWNPEDGTVVYTESDQPRLSEKELSVAFSARSVGSLDSRGTWTTTPRGARIISKEFRMARSNGEWRLRNPLPGTYVDQDYFTYYFDPYSLYFFDPTKSILVPDPVHMLLGDSLATALVKDLLRGPTRGIDGAVSTTVPPTTSVDVGVSISANGVAEIPLSDEILQLSSDDRRLFAAQLVWTLRPVPDISAIVVTVDGQRIDLGVGTQISTGPNTFAGFDPARFGASAQLYALTRRGLVSVTSTGTATVPGPILGPSKHARTAAVDLTAEQAAVVSPDRSTVTVGSTRASETAPTVWYTGGDNVIRPSWDLHGVLWLVDNRSNGARIFAGTDGRPQEVDAQGITGQRVHSIAVSRDGVRLAAIVGRGDHRRLVIAVVERDPNDPTQVSLRRAEPVLTAGVPVRPSSSAGWITPTSIAALVEDESGTKEPGEISIDGAPLLSSFPAFLPIRPVALATGPSDDTPAAVVDMHGALFQQTVTSEWLQIGGGTTFWSPLYPG